MFDVLMLLLCGAFLCWFARAVYIQRLAMEKAYHCDEDHAQEKEE